ncbi:hypothetical protein ASE88_01135 [Sphingomonas sp. Leaf38]|nr:hypothetical protein ASE88_01135 [Sphingomonas sp. Leaf38]
MLHRVQRGAFLVQPARKAPPPFRIDAAHQHLDERAGQLLLLPRRGLFARAQPQHDIAHPGRLAGPERHRSGFAVPLVEQAEHGHALRHRRAAGGDRRGTGVDRLDRGIRRLIGARQLLLDRRHRRHGRGERAVSEPAAHPQHHDQHGRGEPAHDHPSGVQAS